MTEPFMVDLSENQARTRYIADAAFKRYIKEKK